MVQSVSLGGRDFTLRPLKLGQLRRLLDALDGMTGRSGGALVEAAARVVAAGLQAANPDLTEDTVLDLEASLDELSAAVTAILQTAGLRPVGEAQPVAEPRAVPEAITGSSSALFTAPSPPAAATPIPSSTT